MRAARYMRLDPRVVQDEMPIYWQNRAIVAELAEIEAHSLVQKIGHLPGMKPKRRR